MRMKEDRLHWKARALKQPDHRGMGRPQLEDCVTRDVRKAEEDDKWRENAAYREKREEITAGAIHELVSPLYKGGNEEEHIFSAHSEPNEKKLESCMCSHGVRLPNICTFQSDCLENPDRGQMCYT